MQTEYGYMLMKKAVHNAGNVSAESWFDEGRQLLEGVISNRGHIDHYPFHILGSQGLAWANRRSRTPEERRRLLAVCVNVAEEGLRKHPLSRDLKQLQQDLRREVLQTVVGGSSGGGSAGGW